MARPGAQTSPTPASKIRTPESRAKHARELRKIKRPQPVVDAEGNLTPKQRGEPVKILTPEERSGKKKAEPAKDSFDDSVSAETDKLPEKPKASKPKKKKSDKKAD